MIGVGCDAPRRARSANWTLSGLPSDSAPPPAMTATAATAQPASSAVPQHKQEFVVGALAGGAAYQGADKGVDNPASTCQHSQHRQPPDPAAPAQPSDDLMFRHAYQFITVRGSGFISWGSCGSGGSYPRAKYSLPASVACGGKSLVVGCSWNMCLASQGLARYLCQSAAAAARPGCGASSAMSAHMAACAAENAVTAWPGAWAKAGTMAAWRSAWAGLCPLVISQTIQHGVDPGGPASWPGLRWRGLAVLWLRRAREIAMAAWAELARSVA